MKYQLQQHKLQYTLVVEIVRSYVSMHFVQTFIDAFRSDIGSSLHFVQTLVHRCISFRHWFIDAFRSDIGLALAWPINNTHRFNSHLNISLKYSAENIINSVQTVHDTNKYSSLDPNISG